MALEISGKIYRMISPETVERNGRVYTTARLWLDTSRRSPFTGEVEYENYPEIEFRGKNCDLLQSYSAGDIVTVAFDLNGRTYTDRNTGETRNFTRAQGYRITRVQRPSGSDAPAADMPLPSDTAAQATGRTAGMDDPGLPF